VGIVNLVYYTYRCSQDKGQHSVKTRTSSGQLVHSNLYSGLYQN